MRTGFNEKTGKKKGEVQLPGGKSRPNENIYTTAKRICSGLLNIPTDVITFGEHSLIEETSDSASYPGI